MEVVQEDDDDARAFVRLAAVQLNNSDNNDSGGNNRRSLRGRTRLPLERESPVYLQSGRHDPEQVGHDVRDEQVRVDRVAQAAQVPGFAGEKTERNEASSLEFLFFPARSNRPGLFLVSTFTSAGGAGRGIFKERADAAARHLPLSTHF